ncbi:MAG TPA: GH25 family lysozyme [Actinomycetota bacterium]
MAVLVADEYHEDGFQSVYTDLVRVSPFIWIKALEGLSSSENEEFFATRSRQARAAGLKVGAYHWVLMRQDGAAQAEAFLDAAPDADAYALDVEEGTQGKPSFNGDASTATIVRVVRAYVQRLHELLPDKPIVAYGRSFLADRGIVWTDLFQGMPYVIAWIKRYDNAFRGDDVADWTRGDFISYAEPEQIGCPANRVGLIQYTNGEDGPGPMTLSGFNRDGDINALLVPLSRITGDAGDVTTMERRGDDEPDAADRLAELEGFMDVLRRKLGATNDPSKPSTRAGAAARIARTVRRAEKQAASEDGS